MILADSENKKVKVSVIGATGYVGIEIVRILQNHPGVEIASVIGQSFVGQKISDIYPNLRGLCDIECSSLDIDKLPEQADLFINCLPHGISKDFIPLLLQKGKKIIDHGGDYRYKKVEVYEEWYKTKHELPELLKIAVYGLPELYRDKIRNTQLVANPGCYPTCSILGIAPLLKNALINTDNIIIDAASGVTGAGRKSDLPYQFCECTENFKAYNVSSHRHTSEIEQELSILANKEIKVSFTPHLAPMKRGMLATIYANLKAETTAGELISIYKEFYKGESFIRVLDEGKLPETKHVAGSNFIDIGIVVDKRLNRVIVLSALDNLGKGASGQAVQDLNIMCGFPEQTALLNPGLYL
ncbi:MAG TPA: N-acetyl-gamma-glutamyl-phosphate reductase [Clostridiales bacterium]|nr:N-acetyl-gamma-glutamyl-phosphate reductase [Clostridiales bacterium]